MSQPTSDTLEPTKQALFTEQLSAIIRSVRSIPKAPIMPSDAIYDNSFQARLGPAYQASPQARHYSPRSRGFAETELQLVRSVWNFLSPFCQAPITPHLLQAHSRSKHWARFETRRARIERPGQRIIKQILEARAALLLELS